MAEKTKVKVVFAAFEYNGWFGDPELDNSRLAPFLPAMYGALKQWNVRPQDVKYRNVSTANEASVLYELAGGRMSVGLSHAGISITVQNADWSQAELVTQLIEACWATLAVATPNVQLKRHELQITMTTGAPEGKPLKEITRQLASPWHLPPDDELDLCGVILYTRNRTVVLDRAAANPQGLFARIVHRFEEHASIVEMAKQLYEDEVWVGDNLGLEFE